MINKYDYVYAQFIKNIFLNGYKKPDRTNVGTTSSFGEVTDYGMISAEEFPLLTVKQTPFKSVLGELLWFIEGSSSERRLAEITFGKPREELEAKTTIWTENALASYWGDEDLGNVYGKMWRAWPKYQVHDHKTADGYVLQRSVNVSAIDQLDRVIEGLKADPHSRRHLILAWNPSEQSSSEVALPPCHYSFQFVTTLKHQYTIPELNLLVQIRSNDAGLGHPFNLASYALLLLMVAQVTKLTPGQLKFCIGDAHIYNNHIDECLEIIRRESESEVFTPPSLVIDPAIVHIDDFTMSSFALNNYQSGSKLYMPMAT